MAVAATATTVAGNESKAKGKRKAHPQDENGELINQNAIKKSDRISKPKAGNNLILIFSEQHWKDVLFTAESRQQIIVAFFTGTWCGPARQIESVFLDLSNKFGSILFLQVDFQWGIVKWINSEEGIIDTSLNANPFLQWFLQLGVNSLPTFLFIQNREAKEKIVGAFPNYLYQRVAYYDQLAQTQSRNFALTQPNFPLTQIEGSSVNLFSSF